MELTEQQFKKAISQLASKDDLKGLATKSDLAGTKKDLEGSLLATERRLIKHAEGLQEELARMVSKGFEDVQRRLDFTERVQVLEKQMLEIREALHLSPSR